MFNVKWIDIGGDGRVDEYNANVETLAEMELCIRNALIDYLDTLDVQLVHDDELVYEVYAGGRSVGMVAIESL